MSNDNEFDPVAFYESAWADAMRAHNDGTKPNLHAKAIRALAAESAKRQAMKDATYLRDQNKLHMVPAIESCAQAIEREAGL